MKRKTRTLVFSLLVTIAALAAAALIAETFFHRRGPKLPPDTPGLYRPSTIPGLPHEHTPDRKGVIAGVTVHINGLGFRGPELVKGEKRVAVIGDSVVFGQGVNDEETLPALLGKKWNGPVEVINAGVRGYNMSDYLVVLEKKVLPPKPDLVILVITEINDPELTPFTIASPRIEELKKAWWARLPLLKRFAAADYASEVNRVFKEHVSAMYDPESDEWKAFVADLARFRDLCRSSGVRLHAVTFPMMADEDMFASSRARLQQALSDLNIPFTDPRPAFAQLPNSDLVVSPTDFHPNAQALSLTADLLAGELNSLRK